MFMTVAGGAPDSDVLVEASARTLMCWLKHLHSDELSCT